MIRNVVELGHIQRDWNGVEALRARLRSYAAVSGAEGFFPFPLADAAHNVPFIHAYAVLNNVLRQLADEDRFKCKSIFLGSLLSNSRSALSWKDYDLVYAGYKARNAVAHKGELLGRGDCWKYIDAVKVELSLWCLLPT
jgi:hypothetical protein